MTRNRAIDSYRGAAIVLMVFFTVTLRLSADLPDPLRHNVPGALHAGDLVLPMFLFASGLSLAHYLKKREGSGRGALLRDVAERFGTLALVGISLSTFSAYGFLEMDEVMLSALLFLACVALSGVGWKAALGVTLAVNMSYVALMWLGGTGVFEGHYLGGYPAAIFYLPVMLVGFVVGEGIVDRGLWCRENVVSLAFVAVLYFVFLALVPPDKLSATPTLMMLSTMVSFAVLASISGVLTAVKGHGRPGVRPLERLGRKPLRYWLLMYVVVLVPLTLLVRGTGGSFPLDVPWTLGVAASAGIMVLLWSISELVDRIPAERRADRGAR